MFRLKVVAVQDVIGKGGVRQTAVQTRKFQPEETGGMLAPTWACVGYGLVIDVRPRRTLTCGEDLVRVKGSVGPETKKHVDDNVVRKLYSSLEHSLRILHCCCSEKCGHTDIIRMVQTIRYDEIYYSNPNEATTYYWWLLLISNHSSASIQTYIVQNQGHWKAPPSPRCYLLEAHFLSTKSDQTCLLKTTVEAATK